mmetsp:Transcript_22291/g.68763  ORF Transcript_22291/g.68763 Transcript_22291/m.68763 type:complete len:225 (-) Transcript_22291:2033-2707(-)
MCGGTGGRRFTRSAGGSMRLSGSIWKLEAGIQGAEGAGGVVVGGGVVGSTNDASAPPGAFGVGVVPERTLESDIRGAEGAGGVVVAAGGVVGSTNDASAPPGRVGVGGKAGLSVSSSDGPAGPKPAGPKSGALGVGVVPENSSNVPVALRRSSPCSGVSSVRLLYVESVAVVASPIEAVDAECVAFDAMSSLAEVTSMRSGVAAGSGAGGVDSAATATGMLISA